MSIVNSEKVIFHGGCVNCNSQEMYGKKRCVGCKYFECNWDLPNLSTFEEIEGKRMAKIREEFRDADKKTDNMECNKVKIGEEEFYFGVSFDGTYFFKEWEERLMYNTKYWLGLIPYTKATTVNKAVVLFIIPCSILDPIYSKKEVTNMVKQGYEDYIRGIKFKEEIKLRKVELDNCEIINEIKL